MTVNRPRITPQRTLRIIILGAIASCSAACAPVVVDPANGAETVTFRTVEQADLVEIEYLRDPARGPITEEFTTWTLAYRLPVNRPELGLWLDATLPPEASAANAKARVWMPWYGGLLFVPTLGLVKLEKVQFEADPVMMKPRER